MVTHKPASLIVFKYKDATGTSGDGWNAWEDLQESSSSVLTRLSASRQWYWRQQQ